MITTVIAHERSNPGHQLLKPVSAVVKGQRPAEFDSSNITGTRHMHFLGNVCSDDQR